MASSAFHPLLSFFGPCPVALLSLGFAPSILWPHHPPIYQPCQAAILFFSDDFPPGLFPVQCYCLVETVSETDDSGISGVWPCYINPEFSPICPGFSHFTLLFISSACLFIVLIFCDSLFSFLSTSTNHHLLVWQVLKEPLRILSTQTKPTTVNIGQHWVNRTQARPLFP